MGQTTHPSRRPFAGSLSHLLAGRQNEEGRHFGSGLGDKHATPNRVDDAMDASTAADGPTGQNAATPSSAPPRSLSHRVLSGGAWSMAGRVGSMGSLFLLNVVLARALSKQEYSAFLTAASAVPFLSMLATLGV